MKKLKALLSFAAISLGVTTMPVSASVVTVPLVNNAWTFVGVPGFQSFGATAAASGTVWGETDGYTIIDAAGTLGGTDYQVAGLEVPTWDGNVSNPVTATQLATIDDAEAAFSNNQPRDPNGGAGVGSNIYGTVGLMVLGYNTDPSVDVHTSDTVGAATLAAIRLDERVYKSNTSAIRTMYVQSADSTVPDIKIYYQANQEGNTFKIQYQISQASNTLDWQNNTTYEGTFSRDYTYDNAAVIGEDFLVAVPDDTAGTAGNKVKNLLHAFDMDLTDNNLTSEGQNLLEPNTDNAYAWYPNYGEDYTSNAANDQRQTLDGNLTVLWFDTEDQQWRQIRAEGDGTTATITAASDAPETNTYVNPGDLEKGRGYWMKLDPNTAGTSGLVLGYDGDGSIVHGLYSDGADGSYVGDGWNMLSFEDDYLSYSTTGMIVLAADWAAGDFNITDTYGAYRFDFSTVGADANETCQIINASVDGNNTLGLSNLLIKCLPDETNDDIVLVSNRRFTVTFPTGTAAAPTSLAGVALTAESDGVTTDDHFKTLYGEFAMVVQVNNDFLTEVGDGNMSVTYPVNESNVEAAYSAVSTDADTTAGLVTTAMGTASTGLTGAANLVTPVRMIDTNNGNDAILMASNYRFFIKDATQVRVFRYDNTVADANITYDAAGGNQEYNASIRIKGFADYDAIANVDGLVDDDLTATAANITAAAGTTYVYATVLNDANTTLMIYYNGEAQTHASRAGTIDIQEWADGYDVLTEVYPENESNETAQGALKRVWQISTIVETVNDMNSSLEFTGLYETAFEDADVLDLRFNAYYAENFPTSGPLFDLKTGLGVKAESIITGQTAMDGSFISWKQIDVSKPTAEWYDADDQFELFWTEKEKGYWVYINGEATNDLAINDIEVIGSTYAHFNNRFVGAATSANTRNHLNKKLIVNVSNLMEAGANSNTDAYEVYAMVDGKATSFQRDGATNDFILNLDSHETNGIAFDHGQLDITITIAEGSGKKLSQDYTVDYSKPDITNIAVSGAEVTATVANADAVEFHIYTGDINDSSYGGIGKTNWGGNIALTGEDTVLNLGTISSLTFASSFENNATAWEDPSTAFDTGAEQILEGIIRDIRIVAKDDAGLYSNQEQLYYLPWRSGTGVLSHTVGDANEYDSAASIVNDDGTASTWTGDDGIQVKAVGSTGDSITCVYAHQDVKLDEDTAYGRSLLINNAEAGYIMYNPLYVGYPVVCQTASGLFVTGLDDSTNTSGTLTMVRLSTKVSATLAK